MWAPDGDSTHARIALSALEHHAYCPRQAALIHGDDTFTDDVRTTIGSAAHRTVHTPTRPLPPPPTGVRRVTGMPVWSDRLGIYGICDVVEFTHTGTATPVEHKVGPHHPGGPADIQVAAQALCLTDMLDEKITVGYVYSHTDRRRHPVAITAALCAATERTIEALRALLDTRELPAPVNDARCRRCSLAQDCMPALSSTSPPQEYLLRPQPLGNWDA